jgi:hypothetical protein
MNNNTVGSNSFIRPRQVSPIPVGPGGNNPIKQQMNAINTQLTMLNAQATANTKYDPPIPQPITKPITKETFTNEIVYSMFYVVGGLLIVYGLVVN